MRDKHLYDNNCSSEMYTHTDVYRFEPDEMKCNDSLLHNPKHILLLQQLGAQSESPFRNLDSKASSSDNLTTPCRSASNYTGIAQNPTLERACRWCSCAG
jgi:hypothetical protein